MADTEAPDGAECYRRACDLLEQAFATKAVPVGDPWVSESRTVNALDHIDRSAYIAAAQAYATLAQAAATATERWISPVRDDGGHEIQTGRTEYPGV